MVLVGWGLFALWWADGVFSYCIAFLMFYYRLWFNCSFLLHEPSSHLKLIQCIIWHRDHYLRNVAVFCFCFKKMKKIYYSVCVEVFFFLSPSECSEYAVIWYRMPKITVMNYQYFFLFLKDFTSIVIHHLILLISSAVKCMQTVKALEYEQKALWAAVGVWKKSKPPFFVMQSYHHRVSLLSRACLDFIDYQLLWWHYWFFFLYTDCVLASVFPAVFFVFRLLQPQPMNWSILPA